IHVRRAGSWAEQFALLFRDYLRVHPGDRDRYAELKRVLARRLQEDRHAYTEAKVPFIWEVMSRADRWSQEVGWAPGPHLAYTKPCPKGPAAHGSSIACWLWNRGSVQLNSMLRAPLAVSRLGTKYCDWGARSIEFLTFCGLVTPSYARYEC